jgi:hypothetical protein
MRAKILLAIGATFLAVTTALAGTATAVPNAVSVG